MRCKGSVFISPGKDLRTFCTRLWVLWARRHPFAGLHQRQQHESNPLFRHPHDICHPQPQSIGSHQPEAATQLPRSRPGHHARETGTPPKGTAHNLRQHHGPTDTGNRTGADLRYPAGEPVPPREQRNAPGRAGLCPHALRRAPARGAWRSRNFFHLPPPLIQGKMLFFVARNRNRDNPLCRRQRMKLLLKNLGLLMIIAGAALLIVCGLTGNTDDNRVLGAASVIIVMGLVVYITLNKRIDG